MNDLDHRLIGRTPGVGLNSAGWLDATRAAAALDTVAIDAIFASPQPRAIDTALAIGAARGMAVELSHAFDEMDFGAWTGLPFSWLDADPRWVRYNRDRAGTQPPGGESMKAVQQRASLGARTLARQRPGRTVAVVTHADVIRCLLLEAMEAPLDDWSTLPVAPGSISEVLVMRSRLTLPCSDALSARRTPRRPPGRVGGSSDPGARPRTPA